METSRLQSPITPQGLAQGPRVGRPRPETSVRKGPPLATLRWWAAGRLLHTLRERRRHLFPNLRLHRDLQRRQGRLARPGTRVTLGLLVRHRLPRGPRVGSTIGGPPPQISNEREATAVPGGPLPLQAARGCLLILQGRGGRATLQVLDRGTPVLKRITTTILMKSSSPWCVPAHGAAGWP